MHQHRPSPHPSTHAFARLLAVITTLLFGWMPSSFIYFSSAWLLWLSGAQPDRLADIVLVGFSGILGGGLIGAISYRLILSRIPHRFWWIVASACIEGVLYTWLFIRWVLPLQGWA